MNSDELIDILSLLSPEKRKLPLFLYDSRYGMRFPFEKGDLDLSRDEIWHHIRQIGDLYEWSYDHMFNDDVLVEILRFG